MREALGLGRVKRGARERIDRFLIDGAASTTITAAAITELTRRMAEGGDGVAVGRRVRGIVVVDGDDIDGGGEKLGSSGRRTLRGSDIGCGGGGSGGSQLNFVVALNFAQEVAENLRLVRFCKKE